MTKPQISIQIDEEISGRMEEISAKTGIPVSTQIELKLKGFKIVEDPERTLGHLFDDDERLAEVQKRWSEAFGSELLHAKAVKLPTSLNTYRILRWA